MYFCFWTCYAFVWVLFFASAKAATLYWAFSAVRLWSQGGIPKDSLAHEQYHLSNSTWKMTWITHKKAYGSVIHIGSWIALRKLSWTSSVQTPYSSSTGFGHLVLKHKAPYLQEIIWIMRFINCNNRTSFDDDILSNLYKYPYKHIQISST